MAQKAFQDYFPDHLSHCYGCGRLNRHGLRIKSYWDGEETVCRFQPRPYHIAVPGYVYGGLIASIIDCHCACTAAAAVCRAGGRSLDDGPIPVFLTRSLHVDYLRPTPLDEPFEIRASVSEIKGRRAVVDATLHACREICARGRVVVVRAPQHLLAG